jgi:predicted nucleotidyltransferase
MRRRSPTDSVPGLDLLPAHRGLLERAFDQFSDDDRVAGMILGGSLARGTADFYSDVDLYVVTRDGSFDALFDEREAAALAAGSPLFRFAVDPIPGGSRDYIVTYPGPIKLDLMIQLRRSARYTEPRRTGASGRAWPAGTSI